MVASTAGSTATSASGSGRTSVGPFRLQQLVLMEIVVCLSLLARSGAVPVAPATGTAAVLLLLVAVRVHRRSLPEWLGTHCRLRVRVHRARSFEPPAGTAPGLAPAIACDPALRTSAYRAPDGRSVGLIGDGTFLTVVLGVESESTGLRRDRAVAPLSLSLVRDALDVDGIRLASAQLVQHTRRAPAPSLPGHSVVALNYAPLQALTGSPAVRITWIALRFDPALCPEAVAVRGGGLLGAQKCVVRTADQLASRLAGAGFRATALTERELTDAIGLALCAGPSWPGRIAASVTADRPGRPAPSARTLRTRETVHSWQCDDSSHTTYRVIRWPRPGGSVSMPDLVALLTSAGPVLATTFSLTLRRDGPQEDRDAGVVGHLRISGRGDQALRAARGELERTARGVRTVLARLDRDQVPGVLATLPLGGPR